MLFILVAAAEKGAGSMQRRQGILITTVKRNSTNMFEEAKKEVLKKLNNLKVLVSHSRQACI